VTIEKLRFYCANKRRPNRFTFWTVYQ